MKITLNIALLSSSLLIHNVVFTRYFQDFLILLEISISSLNHVIVRLTKTPKLADKKMCLILQTKGFKNANNNI